LICQFVVKINVVIGFKHRICSIKISAELSITLIGFIRLRLKTLQLVAGMKGKANRAEAR